MIVPVTLLSYINLAAVPEPPLTALLLECAQALVRLHPDQLGKLSQVLDQDRVLQLLR